MATERKRGRPKNKTINLSDANLEAVMNIFNKKIFNNSDNPDEINPDKITIAKVDYVNQAKYIAERASSFHLNEIEMRDNFFKPYVMGEVVSLSKRYVKNISAFLKSKAKVFGFEDLIGLVEAFEAAHTKHNNGSGDGHRLSGGSLKENICGLLTENHWYIYERIGKAQNNAGIAVGKVQFEFSSSGRLEVSMTFMYKDIQHVYFGYCEWDEKPNYVYLHLQLQGTMKQAFVALTLSEIDNMSQTVFLGHFMYFSGEYGHLLTKAVVLQKENSIYKYQVVGNYEFDSEEYKAINVGITSFLYSREKNRLSHPSRISNEVDLEKFITEKKAKRINTALKNFIGEFKVYYRDAQKDIQEDGLSIGLNANLSVIEANYIHSPDIFQGNDKTWRGPVYFNKNSVIIELGEIANLDVPQDPILLTFYIPGQNLRDSETDCFPGLLTGLKDKEKTPVSYICLAVRKNANDFKDLNDGRLDRFFPKSQKTILTPPISPFRIANL